MLFWHFRRLAASRTFCTAGSSRPIKTAMMAITTRSSMSVNPRLWRVLDRFMGDLLYKGEADGFFGQRRKTVALGAVSPAPARPTFAPRFRTTKRTWRISILFAHGTRIVKKNVQGNSASPRGERLNRSPTIHRVFAVLI